MSTPAATPLPVTRLRFATPALREATLAEIAVEMPINIVYGTMPYAVMMASPIDLEDFVLGFSLTEGVIAEAADIRSTTIRAEPEGMVVDIELLPARVRSHLAQTRRRNLTGRTSCGLCGIESIDDVPMAQRGVGARAAITPEAILRALDSLDAHQHLHHRTASVHAAVWCDTEGGIVTVREDVGRHNALDKLIGARLRAGCTRDGFILVTSRASFEMVEKAAIFGAATMVAISAPTSLAIERAKCLGLTLVASARGGGAVVYAGAVSAS